MIKYNYQNSPVHFLIHLWHLDIVEVLAFIYLNNEENASNWKSIGSDFALYKVYNNFQNLSKQPFIQLKELVQRTIMDK